MLFRLLILPTAFLIGQPVWAATMAVPSAAIMPRGEAMAQRMLPSDLPGSSLSVVTTVEGAVCVASRKIEIAQSDYRTADGAAVPFARIIRSVGASVQAIGDAGNGAPVFRVQLKFSPDPAQPLWLDLGDGPVDVSGLLEPSTDSLRLEGDLAARLALAFAAGHEVGLVAVSGDTGRRVTDVLPAPDLAGLAGCRATELADAAAPGAEAALVTVSFRASPTPETLATPETLQTCAMTPTDLPVHEGRLTGTTGMFAQTSRVFVAFDAARQPVRVYIPGIFDAGVDATGQGTARVSRAADGNVPGAENDVKGCLGAASMDVCAVPVPGDPNGWTMQPCDMVPGTDFLDGGPGGGIGPVPASLTSRVPPGRTSVPPSSLIVDSNDDDDESEPDPASLIVKVKDDPPPPPPPPPPPIPLPAAGWLMLAGIGALVAVKRRRAG